MIVIQHDHFSIEDNRKRNIYGDGLFGDYILIAYNFQDLFAIEHGDEREGGGMYLWSVGFKNFFDFDLDDNNHLKVLGVDAYDF